MALKPELAGSMGDDGLLVRDLNGNGAELCGDGTRLQNGQLAGTGFAVLADLDSDKDGIIDAADNVYAELKIWRDLNQDGISQANRKWSLIL